MRIKRTLFISDLHLDESRPVIVEQFERFVREIAPGSEALYILGDLFEYWVGDDGLELAFPRHIAGMLESLARDEPVFFMHGNRDFLVAERFARATGVRLIEDPTRIDLYGIDTLLMHGDTLCTDDVAYQRLRAQVRDPAWQRATLAQPLAARLALAQGLRSESEGAKRSKAMEIMDVSPAAVAAAFERCECTLMIHGHTHRPGRHIHRVLGKDRVRWVLPDWYARGGYLEASPTGIRAVDAF